MNCRGCVATRAALVALAAACGSRSTSDQTVRIAAAANNAKAFEEVGKAFTEKTGIRASFSFQASGTLEHQIEQGEPYFVFLSANEAFADEAVASGKCDPASKAVFARGRLVALAAKGAGLPTSLADLAEPAFKRIAIANPDVAPYGKAARQALQNAGVWDRVKDRLVVADNIEAAAELAMSRNVDVALVAQSLAVVDNGGQSMAVDPALYDPLDEYLVTCGTGPELVRAQAFVAFLVSPEGREIITRYGFSLPAR